MTTRKDLRNDIGMGVLEDLSLAVGKIRKCLDEGDLMAALVLVDNFEVIDGRVCTDGLYAGLALFIAGEYPITGDNKVLDEITLKIIEACGKRSTYLRDSGATSPLEPPLY